MVTGIDRYEDVDVFVGLDVGKGEHHAVALDKTGKRLLDKALPNDERRLRAVSAMIAASRASVFASPGCRSAMRRIASPGR